MKKTIHSSYSLPLIVIACVLFVSCSKNGNDNPPPATDAIAVNLTIAVDGTLSNSPSIEYNDDKGERKTEVLSEDWAKTFSVNSGYKLFLKVKGTIDGTIGIKATAEGNGNSFNDDNNFGGSPKDFDHTIETTLE